MKKFRRITAATLALVMSVAGTSQLFAADDTKIETSFGVYSPELHVSVPVNAAVQVNPIYDTAKTNVKYFSVASEQLDIFNATVDLDEDVAIPCVANVKATVTTKKGAGVQTKYNTFAANDASTKKVINLNLAAVAGAAAVNDADAGIATGMTWESNDKHLVKFETDVTSKKYATFKMPEGNFKTATNKAPITVWGSKVSFAIPAATTTDTTDGATFSTDAKKITAGGASFAIIGDANIGADWAADDVNVGLTYDIKASRPEAALAQTAIASAPTWTNGASAADLSIVVPNVGEATVVAIAAHNDDPSIADVYGDYFFDPKSDTVANGFTVTYAPNATTATQTDATIKIAKDYPSLAFLAGGSDPDNSPYVGKAQDFVVALSDGRFVVTTLTCNKAS